MELRQCLELSCNLCVRSPNMLFVTVHLLIAGKAPMNTNNYLQSAALVFCNLPAGSLWPPCSTLRRKPEEALHLWLTQ